MNLFFSKSLNILLPVLQEKRCEYECLSIYVIVRLFLEYDLCTHFLCRTVCYTKEKN